MQKNSSRLKKIVNSKPAPLSLNSFLTIYATIPLTDLTASPLGPIKFRQVKDYIAFVLNLFMGIGVGLAVIFLVLAGIAWATSQGDPKAVQKAQVKLTWAIIGFVIVIGAIAGKVLVESLLGASPTPILPGF